MKIPEGEKVVILESGETGVILYYDGKTAFIDVNGELRQAHMNDIDRADQKLSNIGKIQPSKNEDVANIPALQMQFSGIRNNEGEINNFEVGLINNSDREILFECEFILEDIVHHKIKNVVLPGETKILHEFMLDYLNDSPIWNYNFWLKQHDPDESGNFQCGIRLKAKQFFQRVEADEFKKSGIFFITIIGAIPGRKGSENARTMDFDFDILKKQPLKKNELMEKVTMPDHIDLHMEKLMPGTRINSASEILQHQLSAFKTFLEKAIRFNLHRIYIVHGLGKGVLKQEIEKILEEYPEVKSFNNDYNPRFGFGATEIFLE